MACSIAQLPSYNPNNLTENPQILPSIAKYNCLSGATEYPVQTVEADLVTEAKTWVTSLSPNSIRTVSRVVARAAEMKTNIIFMIKKYKIFLSSFLRAEKTLH